MSTPRRPPLPQRRPDTDPVVGERQPSHAASGRALPLAAGLLGISVVVLVMLLAWPKIDGMGRAPQRPLTAGEMSATAGGKAPTRPIAEATEVTATPSRGEPTDVVPSSAAPDAIPAQGTVVPATAAAPAAVQITCADAVNNDTGEVCVHTTPGATLSITVTYCSGQEAHNTDLQGTRNADGFGNYTWTWVPETTCPGTAVAHVIASGEGGSSDATAPFQVSP